ncbi:hypothetical protein [Aurantiacibacter marinus]|uniref:Transferrin-binding protein B C-lobe/N-lobe beta barrel domain-containing protein n=1 Tax=Aurantiacibacter marinus TaxID=874156 RepID=A0A0H0XK18_9SPHN|nr:hypothetical protein [Aurantiacibacter marinus]KLI62938.1 hypothetical protein AAV99_12855 [Aurantiacibacter marinus]
MLRKIGLLLSVAACGALVTSCGDDETTTPTPTPTDTSTATPTPTPTSVINFSLTTDFSATSFNANYGYAFFTPNGGGTEVFSGGTRLNGTSGISFVASPESATFLFPDLSDTVVFGAGDFVSVSPTQRQYAAGDTALTLFLPFTHVMRVNYEIDNQAFTRDSVDGTLRSQRTAVFFNNVTTTDDLTATLSYTGAVDVTGGDPGVTAAGAVTAPDVTFTVTPGTEDTLTGTINLFETVMGAPTQIASFSISATVSASGVFQGTITDTANDLTGNYVGSLAGANREEILILFAAQDANVAGAADDGDDRVYVGSYIGN